MPFYLLLFSFIFLCACSPQANAPLKNTYWSLSELRGENIVKVEHQPTIHLIFHINDASLQGSDGCNRFQGEYLQNGTTFSFKKLNSTRISCTEERTQSADFMQVLHQTDRIQIKGDQLILFSADIEIARFEGKEDY